MVTTQRPVQMASTWVLPSGPQETANASSKVTQIRL